MRRNRGYSWQFFDDMQVDKLVRENFDQRTYDAFARLQIGAAKADFFRYAVLYIYGGIYLDLDSDITGRLDRVIRPDDVAVIAHENNRSLYAQWALIYDKGHPFLKKTIELIVKNIEENRYPHDVHRMTGPTVYTEAINLVLQENPQVAFRRIVDDYQGLLKFKYKLSKILIYGDRSLHWKKMQLNTPVVKPKGE
ncbi:glycosyltransferase family 32 protein [Sphingobacterium thalpophilum]|uniref:glycosyltransferase family 32 protein n=1 Tax=Sphingobacterium thalpophilum TaxID=259 RepID=UPI002D764ECD|nr:glycosyltransferase [Sphingobacterium thalpophilum]